MLGAQAFVVVALLVGAGGALAQATAAGPDRSAAAPAADPTAAQMVERFTARPLFRGASGPLPDSETHRCSPAAAERGLLRNIGKVPYVGGEQPKVDLNVHFATGSDALTEHDRELLGTLARALADERVRELRFAIAGHTDATGEAQGNLRLSCARALAVVEFLVKSGIGAPRLSAFGFGSNRPVQADAVESAQNRRVEVRRAD